MKIEKFPQIFYHGRQLIWDVRQEPQTSEYILLGPENFAVQDALLKRKNAELLGGQNDKFFLGQKISEALGHPSKHLKVIAVTGTNGKTTCVNLMRTVLIAMQKSVAQLGTEGLSLWRKGRCVFREEVGWTTPPAPILHQVIRQLVDQGYEYLVMEVSSHALALGRVAGVHFDGALFTNLSQDHLDFHKTMSAYGEAKKSLFTEFLSQSDKTRFVVLNGNDAFADVILRDLPLSHHVEIFSRPETYHIVSRRLNGQDIYFSDGRCFYINLIGTHNAENFVGALRIVEKVSGQHLVAGQNFVMHVPGRLERVDYPQSKKIVFVDYAHTPDALEKVLKTLKENLPDPAALWVVFGCGGDRDATKRPKMGKVAHELADHVVVTSDNPRSENPEKIIDEIMLGCPLALRQVDRAKAIQETLKSMGTQDVLLVAGKGHENYQWIGAQKIPFSDFEVCMEALRAYP